MGQVFNLSRMHLLENMMAENISAFVQALHQRGPRPVEVVQACRALEADIVCEFALFTIAILITVLRHLL